jgi:hypothetical protein
MGIEQFRDNDRGCLTWIAAHIAGYVINVQRNLNPVPDCTARTVTRATASQPGAVPGPGRTHYRR